MTKARFSSKFIRMMEEMEAKRPQLEEVKERLYAVLQEHGYSRSDNPKH